MPKAPLLAALAAACFLLPAEPSAGESGSLQVGIGRGAMTVTEDGGSAVLERDGRSPLRLDSTEAVSVADLAVDGDTWMVAGTRRALDRRQHLWLVAGAGDTQREIEPPGRQTGRLRDTPVLLDGDALLAGSGGAMAWLEGGTARNQAVWAARWSGDGFEAPVVVAPAAAGTQSGLCGATLADGTWLLVWSAYDGEDQELRWSRYDGSRWSEPSPVLADDRARVPDITPTIRAAGAGALLVWSRYDGNDYRLAAARFEQGAWSAPSMVGERGSVDPRFVSDTGEPLLTYLRASPRAWAVAEIDPEAASIRAVASAPSDLAERPLVLSRDADGVRLGWSTEGKRAGIVAAGRWEPVQ